MPGSGLGLHITQQIVDLHGGSITAAQRTDGAGAPSPSVCRIAASRVTARGRILVVEDDESLRETLAEVLADDGHEVRVAADGEAALAAIQAWAPELIVLDLMMPRMDGYRVPAGTAGAAGRVADEGPAPLGRPQGRSGCGGAPGRRLAGQAVRTRGRAGVGRRSCSARHD